VRVADHSLEAGHFEGVHEGATRGSGAVIIWDEGSADVLRDEPDHVSVVLHGQKLAGRFGLTKTGDQRWILVKANDDHARPGSGVVAPRQRAFGPAGRGSRSQRASDRASADAIPPSDGR
jgi:DNA polymerase Ligase (LigD)